MLRIEPILESSRTERREEYDIDHIIHVKSSYSYQDNRLLGAILTILGAASAIFGLQSSDGGIFLGFGALLLIVGIILLLIKSEQVKLTLSLSNGTQNEYSMTIDNKSLYELMDRITSSRNT